MLMNETENVALDNFLADNDELEQLSAQLATFNVFRVFGSEKGSERFAPEGKKGAKKGSELFSLDATRKGG